MRDMSFMDDETIGIINRFNDYTIKAYRDENGHERGRIYSADEVQNILNTYRGVISPGAIYKWPDNKGDKYHVTGFGLIDMHGELWFLAGFNSKKLGKPRIEKLYPKKVLAMIEHGEVEYLGNIFNKAFRKEFDYERLSLAIVGFASLAYTMKLQKNVSVDEILDDLETGKMTMDQLLQKCGSVETTDMV